MTRVFLAAILTLSLLLPVAAPQVAMAQDRIEVAQQKKRTLWDMLFGTQDETPQRQKRQPAQRAPQARLPEPEPEVEKAADATRLAVFGDSLAVDLAKGLERFYREDPNLVVIGQGVGSSGFVRDDYFDWNAAIEKAIAEDSFDIAVVIIGINDRQNLTVAGSSVKPLTDEWKTAYSARLSAFLGHLRAAGKPVIWVELPPMQASSYSAAMTQISSLHRLAAFSAGAEFVEIYEKFADENGNYVAFGPDLNGVSVQMRKADGIHFSAAGSDKLAFYINQSLKRFYRGGTISLEVADPLAGTDAQNMQRPPFQGLGQVRLLEVAGAVMPLGTTTARRADELIDAGEAQVTPAEFPLDDLLMAPTGRADAFGVGVEPRGEDGPPVD